MHITKGKTLAQSVSDRTDYGLNPEKTNDGELTSASACVGIADQGDHREVVLLAQAALGVAHAPHVLQALFQIPDLPADVSAVGLQLRLTGTACPDRRRAHV